MGVVGAVEAVHVGEDLERDFRGSASKREALEALEVAGSGLSSGGGGRKGPRRMSGCCRRRSPPRRGYPASHRIGHRDSGTTLLVARWSCSLAAAARPPCPGDHGGRTGGRLARLFGG